jgi:hypothetical protein
VAQIEIRRAAGLGQLSEGKRQQGEDRDPAGETLGHPGQQIELLRACEHETPHPACAVHDALKIGQQRRYPLHLIQNRTLRIAFQKRPRIVLREQPLVRILKRDIRFGRERTPRQRGLAGLTRASERENWEALSQGGQ